MNCCATFIGIAAILCGLAGCVPERVAWSPDGTRAAVLGDDGLHLADSDGNLGPVIASLPDESGAKVVAWLPDGRRLVVLDETELSTWKEVAGAYPERAKTIAGDAGLLARTREAILHAASTAANAEAFGQALPQGDDDERWATVYLRDNDSTALRAQVGDRWATLAALRISDTVAHLVTLRPAGRADVGPPIWHGMPGAIFSVRVCPNGAAVAITGSEADHHRKATLSIVAVDGSARRELGEGALYPDWSPDGRYLVYIKPVATIGNQPDSGRLGMLVRQELFDAAGHANFAGSDVPLPKEESLVGLIFEDGCRVRVSKDGRIFFVAAEITLPTTPADFNPKPLLFSIDPGKQATVNRVIPRSSEADLGDAPGLFELSPDATHMSVPFQDGRVSVVDLGTGTVTAVQPLAIGGGQGDRLSSTPSWRPNAAGGELTFVMPSVKDGPPTSVVRYNVTDGKGTDFSAKWPGAARGKWLASPSASTGPATAR